MTVALGHSLPPIVPFRTTVVVKQSESGGVEFLDENSGTIDGTSVKSNPEAFNFVMPVSLGIDGRDLVKMPVDPMIALTGKNIIARRYVSKKRTGGTIKELWSQDDWNIQISGTFIYDTIEECGEQVRMLRELCQQGKTGLSIENDVLWNYYGIYRIAVEIFEFPFTPGEGNQDFIIRGYSDEVYDLLIKNDNV